MILSMTGFGRATCELDGEIIQIELTAVNHRYLECSFRLPSAWYALEVTLRECVRQKVARGKLNINVRRDRARMQQRQMQFDPETAQQYVDAAEALRKLMSSTENLALNTLVQLEGVFYAEEAEEDLEKVGKVLCRGLEDALEQFNAAREKEGVALAEDLALRIDLMRGSLTVIEGRTPELIHEYETRLWTRVKELNTEVGMAEDRLAVEVALMAEKADVTEELVRLKAHFDHVDSLLKNADPVGRELNFLSQEIQRETNTLGSKLRDVGVTREVLKMKSELEKFKEQAQNIE